MGIYGPIVTATECLAFTGFGSSSEQTSKENPMLHKNSMVIFV